MYLLSFLKQPQKYKNIHNGLVATCHFVLIHFFFQFFFFFVMYNTNHGSIKSYPKLENDTSVRGTVPPSVCL